MLCRLSLVILFLLECNSFLLDRSQLRHALLGSGDAGNQGQRHHGHLTSATNVADAEKSVDRVFARLGSSETDREEKCAFLECGRHYLLVEGDAVVLRGKFDHSIPV